MNVSSQKRRRMLRTGQERRGQDSEERCVRIDGRQILTVTIFSRVTLPGFPHPTVAN